MALFLPENALMRKVSDGSLPRFVKLSCHISVYEALLIGSRNKESVGILH